MTTKQASQKKPALKRAVKTAPKKAAKKTSSRNTSKVTSPRAVKTTSKARQREKRTLVQAPNGKTFWVNDGQVIANLLELRDVLEQMEQAVFAHHVNKDKNDFADWVEQVLLDGECARALRASKKPGNARTVVLRHLKFYAV